VGAKKISKKKMLVTASVAGLLAVSGAVLPHTAAFAADVHCHGVNACKGVGDCGGKGHGCAGKNSCKGEGWVGFPSEELCSKVGGTVK
jgi:uncharacterized membrane protein